MSRLRDPLADVEPLISRVYAYAAYRLGDGAEAEDVTSATFERALRYRDSYRETRSEPINWLIGIARRCIADAVRARLPLAEVGDAPDERDFALEVVRNADLQSALATLGERDRELLALRYGADLTARQIAELLGLRTNSVEVALHRALARLRPLLEPEAPRTVRRPAADASSTTLQ
jgi:RNA polymerase sigma-70 factor, ECF subfamily